MKKLTFLILIFSICILRTYATHQRAGEITYRHISGLTYEITIITYSYAPSLADRNELEIHWGDGATAILPRINGPAGINPAGIPSEHLGEIVGPDIKKNIYLGQHTYPSASDFLIWLEDPNRNNGILNIPNSVETPLYIETLLTINPFLLPNNSPQLLISPIDNGCVGIPYIHNPGAYDPDGDSLSFRLVNCRGTQGQQIPGYTLPQYSESFTLNPITGDVIWNTPIMQGEYNIAFLVEEWRNGTRIGYVTRDMQINIISCNNTPPQIFTISDTCVTAGETLSFNVTATDPEGDLVELSGTGGPLEEYEALFETTEATGSITVPFTWTPKCAQIRKQPHLVYFRAEDKSGLPNLVNITTTQIHVLAPPPELLTATPNQQTIALSWTPYKCPNANGISIYRSNEPVNYTPAICTTGLPPETGYIKVASVPISQTSFTDNNNGEGLIRGINYCYRIVATFPDGCQSYPSNEMCATLKKDLPIITQASIRTTDKVNGSALITWSKATELNPNITPGPFQYEIFHSDDLQGGNFTKIETLNSINDTLFIDTLINTTEKTYSYRIDFYNNTQGNRFLIGSTHIAASLHLNIIPSDNELLLSWPVNVPWINKYYTIYRYNTLSSTFDSIGYSNTNSYTDTELINATSYCYKIKSQGYYSAGGTIAPILNFSQRQCGTPLDNKPPCPPTLNIKVNCEQIENILTWNNPNLSCANDVFKYYIYYTPLIEQDFIRLDSTIGAENTTYIHKNLISITGCYYITACDTTGNESAFSNALCISPDSCGIYELPNVFTPNNDGYNDFFTPMEETAAGVEQINLQIFNRWGEKVFSTHDPLILWDGHHSLTGKACSQGVYFYICDVFENTLTGVRKKKLQGVIHIIR